MQGNGRTVALVFAAIKPIFSEQSPGVVHTLCAPFCKLFFGPASLDGLVKAKHEEASRRIDVRIRRT
jgi:hypothetical protein